MDTKEKLAHGPLTESTVHLCVDMQNLFSDGAPWATPWMKRVLPAVSALSERHAKSTIFTRFIPPTAPADAPGQWKTFYSHWRDVTREQIDPDLLELVPALARFVPPAVVLKKDRYSPFYGTGLAANLRQRRITAIVVSGAETDVCVLSAVLDAVDIGFRVVVVSDAICSSSNDTHDALVKLYRCRFKHQVDIADVETVLRNWRTA